MAVVTNKVIWPNYDQTNVKIAGKTEDDKTSLSKDAFLELLVTQLKNQDPLSPQSNTEFIAQMAQFTSVEQLMNMNTQLTQLNSSISSASMMIGKSVTWQELDKKGSTVMYTDVVKSIVSTDGVLYAKFEDNTMIKVSDILTVSDEAPAVAEEPEADGEASNETNVAEDAGTAEGDTAAESGEEQTS
ncbi:flagellar hook capping FlgD N-terminal domain-containing protein [Paenibacillus sp. BIHB 4019]|uniref:flagellar hook capping FlgD N-terminal domain-containing protein n=1 Tax=Paenibacillus sp. BIHB 4019 TaxID=1870819 RepID=UPI0015583BFB|nr:flagellar hook capping FlgD N-terminal domain-containing protein [Paenibacillus sp. BIHB 4019]